MGNWVLLLIVALFTPHTTVMGDIRVPTFFSDNMILQRGNASIWGRAAARATVEVAVMSDSKHILFTDKVVSGPNGKFVLSILGVKAQNSTVVVINGTNSTGITLKNVAFGDVYICSGQSNMEYPLADAFNGADERDHHSNFPDLRMLTVARAQSAVPVEDASSLAPYIWGAAAPDNISPRVTGSFGVPYPSAVCFFAIRELLRKPPTTSRFPIGIITITVGGTPIEAWSSAESILDGTPSVYGGNGTCGGTIQPTHTGTHAITGNATCNPKSRSASSLYNGMIAPFLPMRVSAILWYQGEENDHENDACYGPVWYRCLFPSMIQHWRLAFDAPNLPFVYVLLAGGHTAAMREAQFEGAGALPYTAFASAMDLGAYGDEFLVPGHPPRKQEVGRRISLLLRNLVYNTSHTVTPASRGARVLGHQVSVTQHVSTADTVGMGGQTGTTTTVARIPFMVAQDVLGTLHLNGTGSCPIVGKTVEACCNNSSDPYSHIVAFSDPDGNQPGTFRADNVTIDATNNLIIATLTSTEFGATSKNRVEVRFMFDDNPTCALYAGKLSGPDSVYASVPHFGLPAEMWRGVVPASHV